MPRSSPMAEPAMTMPGRRSSTRSVWSAGADATRVLGILNPISGGRDECHHGEHQ